MNEAPHVAKGNSSNSAATGNARRRLKLTAFLLRDKYSEERELLEARQI